MATGFLHSRSLRCHKAPYGGSLIELLVGCLVAVMTGAALVSLQQSSYMANATVLGQNYANASSRRPLDILGDTLRNAQAVGVGAASKALVSASVSDVTCYTATGTTRIWLDASTHSLMREKTESAEESIVSKEHEKIANVGGSIAVGQVLVANVQSLQITYYRPAGNAYNAGVGAWTTTADPNAPSEAELPGVGAVNIVATISANGETRTLQSFVRMRNSPNTHDS